MCVWYFFYYIYDCLKCFVLDAWNGHLSNIKAAHLCGVTNNVVWLHARKFSQDAENGVNFKVQGFFSLGMGWYAGYLGIGSILVKYLEKILKLPLCLPTHIMEGRVNQNLKKLYAFIPIFSSICRLLQQDVEQNCHVLVTTLYNPSLNLQHI